MLKGIYAAATGMDAALKSHETLSRNLAHASVPGFRRTVVPFSAIEQNTQNAYGGAEPSTVGVQPQAPAIDFTQGPLEQTGNPLDVAIDGDAFFTIDGPNGPLYTRSGAFHIDAAGKLVNADGLAVHGDQGPITLPENATASQLQISPDGGVHIGKENIGQLALVTFDDPQKLISVGATLFQAPGTSPPKPATATVIQGARELSNVNAISELVALITAQRHYEASQRAMSTIDKSMQRRVEAN